MSDATVKEVRLASSAVKSPLALILPSTVSISAGVVVPIPTLPPLVAFILLTKSKSNPNSEPPVYLVVVVTNAVPSWF